MWKRFLKNMYGIGNLRELKNVIKRATLLTEGDFIEARTLPFEISNYSKLQFADQPAGNTGNTVLSQHRKQRLQ